MGEREVITEERWVEEQSERKQKKSKEKRAKEKKRKREERLNKMFNIGSFFNAFMFIAALAITIVLVFMGNIFEEKYIIKVGDISRERFIAEFQVVNRVATEEKIQKVKENEKPLYKKDANIMTEAVENVETYFVSIQEAKKLKEKKEKAEQGSEEETADRELGDVPSDKEVVKIEIDVKEELSSEVSGTEETPEIPLFLNEQKYKLLLEMEDKELDNLKNDIITIVVDVMDIGVMEEKLSVAINNAKDKIDKLSWNSQIKDIAYSVASSVIQPNTFVDEDATQRAIEKAIMEVEPVIVRKGEKIVDKDEVITDEIYAILQDAGYIQQKEWDINELMPILGGVVLFLSLEIFLCIYLKSTESELWNLGGKNKINRKNIPVEEKGKTKRNLKERWQDFNSNINEAWQINKNKAMIFVAYCIVILLSKIMSGFSYTIMPVALWGMFVILLMSLPAAIVANLVMSIIGALICGGNIKAFLYFLISGSCTGIYMTFKDKERNNFVKVIMMAGLTNICVFVGVELIFGSTFEKEFFTEMFQAFLSAVVMVIVVIGSEVVWENIFGVVTTAKLNDLANPNKPLLIELHDRANGTYQHSMAVANIGQNAALKIGANSLLVRAAAYYHDIGKMKKPNYFAENQEGGDNPHDRELEGDSVKIIKDHVQLGCQKAEECKLPKVIIDMIYQHHGTTFIGGFYYKAVENYGKENVDEKKYKYNNEVPQTKEAAILMLADSVEAATRAQYKQGKTVEELENMVSVILNGKFNEGQLFESGLSFEEFKLIEESFKASIKGMYHGRPVYHKGYLKGVEDKAKEKEVKEEKTEEKEEK